MNRVSSIRPLPAALVSSRFVVTGFIWGLLSAGSPSALAQSAVFGSQRVITNSAEFASSVYATDLDGDGDADVLSASATDDKIAWYENLGSGAFGPRQVITASANGAVFVLSLIHI